MKKNKRDKENEKIDQKRGMKRGSRTLYSQSIARNIV